MQAHLATANQGNVCPALSAELQTFCSLLWEAGAHPVSDSDLETLVRREHDAVETEAAGRELLVELGALRKQYGSFWLNLAGE